VRHVNWERHGLIEPWHELADVVEFNWPIDDDPSRWTAAQKAAFNDMLLQHVQAAHCQQPIDLFFSCLSGLTTRRQTIESINALGIVTANISLDDTLKFWAGHDADGYTGTAQIAPAYDLSITTQNPTDVARYVYSGAHAVYMPPGGNPRAFEPMDLPVKLDVSFIGQCYGLRAELIARLRREGVSVQTFGQGWPAGPVDLGEMNRIYASSLINLGFSHILDYDNLMGFKGRDFEVPLCGRLYLTTWHQPLANCFQLGREVASYRDENDLVRQVKYYLANRDQALAIGVAGRRRCLADHTWAQRFRCLLDILTPAVPVEQFHEQLDVVVRQAFPSARHAR
jgi:spore maturation protein CgeB